MDQCKTCARCKEAKPLTDYRPGKKWRDGLFPYCGDCRRAASSEAYYRHRESRLVRDRAKYAANPDVCRARVKARYALKKTEIRAYQKTWEAANPEKQRARRAKWAKANQAELNRHNRERRARKMGAPSIPFTSAQLAARMAYFGDRCWVCGVAGEAVDHVKPLSRGGWHCLSNLRPICTPCNTRKKDRWPLTKEQLWVTQWRPVAVPGVRL